MKIVCPFCPLRCTDVDVHPTSVGLTVDPQQCGLAEHRTGALTGIVDGLDETEFQQMFVSLTKPLAADQGRTSLSIEGTIVEINTARAAIRLAASANAMVDVNTSACERSFTEARERDGEIAATLGEMRERADSIVLLGHADLDYPRLLSRFSRPANATMVQLPPGGLREVLHRTLESLKSGTHNNNSTPKDGAALATWLLAGKYTVWVGEDEAIEPMDAVLIQQIIESLNRRRRAVRISLTESTTFRSVAAWLTGLGGPLNFSDELPRLVDPRLQEKYGLRIWLQPFPDSPPPPRDDAKLLVVGAADQALAKRADGYLRTAVPGIELAGTTFRGDGTVCLPLAAPIKSRFPSAAMVLDGIAGCLPLKQDPSFLGGQR